MSFQAQIDQELIIDGQPHRVLSHPMAPLLPYGQEGRMATVYKLASPNGARALKVFKPAYRDPAISALSRRLRPYARLRGLEVCERIVLDPENHARLLAAEPDLQYAVVMPWVEGVTWMDVMTGDEFLSPEQSFNLVRRFCQVLVSLENRGVAHCDLSGPNVLITNLERQPAIYLVDVEQLFGPEMEQPSLFLVGTPGYNHERAPDELWGRYGDRFAGAILIAEMLGWCDDKVRRATWGESYFDPAEIHREGERFEILYAALRAYWGETAADLFAGAWLSTRPSDCADFTHWLDVLGGEAKREPDDETVVPDEPDPLVSLVEQAEQRAEAGDYAEAIALLQRARQVAEDQGLSTQGLTEQINALSARQVKQALVGGDGPVLVRPVDRPGGPEGLDQAELEAVTTGPRRYTPAGKLAQRFAGLTGRQFAAVFVGFLVLAAVLMSLATIFLRDKPIWGLIPPHALLGSALIVGLRRRWLPGTIYATAYAVGGLITEMVRGVSAWEVLAVALVGGVVLEALAQLGARFIPDPLRAWRADLAWVAAASAIATAAADESLTFGVERLNEPLYLLSAAVLAVLGWFLGDYLHQFLIAIREHSR